jgi:hypothetical protein
VNPEIALLLDLQKRDQGLAELAAEIRHLEGRIKQIERTLTQERAAVEATRERLSQTERDSRLRNLDVDSLDVQVREHQKRLDKGIISFKEMESLGVQIAGERKRMSALEDEALGLMDTIEATRAELVLAAERLVVRERELAAASTEVAAQLEATRANLASRTAERSETAARLPSHLLRRYESLHAQVTDAIVTMGNGSCSGCKLRLSGNTVERTRSGAEIVTCENCSRILFVR